MRKKLPTLADSFRVYHREEDKLLSASFDGLGLSQLPQRSNLRSPQVSRVGLPLISSHAKPLVDKHLEHATEWWVTSEEGVKSRAVQAQQVHLGDGPCCGHARALVYKSHFSETLTWTQARQSLLVLPLVLLKHLDFTVHDDIQPVAAVSLAEDDLVWLEMLSAQAGRLSKLELDDVGWQQQIKEPVGRDS